MAKASTNTYVKDSMRRTALTPGMGARTGERRLARRVISGCARRELYRQRRGPVEELRARIRRHQVYITLPTRRSTPAPTRSAIDGKARSRNIGKLHLLHRAKISQP